MNSDSKIGMITVFVVLGIMLSLISLLSQGELASTNNQQGTPSTQSFTMIIYGTGNMITSTNGVTGNCPSTSDKSEVFVTINGGGTNNAIKGTAKCYQGGNTATAIQSDPGNGNTLIKTGEAVLGTSTAKCSYVYTPVAAPASDWTVSCTFN